MAAKNLSRGETTRRTEIIQAAHDLFVQQGYHGTSMRQIAKKAGIALGGLYNHFKSKEDVFREVFFEYHPYHDVLPALQSARGDTVEEVVQDGINRIIATLETHPEFMNLVFIEVVEFKSAHMHELFDILQPQMTRIVQRVVLANSERLRPIPALMMVRIYLGLFFAYYLTEIIFAEQAPPEFCENAVDYFIDVFLHGVLKER